MLYMEVILNCFILMNCYYNANSFYKMLDKDFFKNLINVSVFL